MSKVKEKKKKNLTVEMVMVNPNAAGIDIGSSMHAVAVPPGRDKICVKEFGTFTCDLKLIAQWLHKCDIDTVAMESTGVYWKQLFAVLVQEGFEVYLVNSKNTKNVSGRKTDEDDAMWIQRLHSCGLLKTSFLPDDQTESLRSLVRHRRSLTSDSSRYILRMQKAMEMMNIKVHTVISNIVGKTGTAIVEAIIKGERNAENFLPFIDRRIKADSGEILKSLEANWRQEHLFLLEQSYTLYKFLQQQIALCDKQIEMILQQYVAVREEGVLEPVAPTPSCPTKGKRKNKNAPIFNTAAYLRKIHQVDVLEIFGISETCALEILGETGTDLSKWETENKFVSWLNLCPNNKISGGKLISSNLLRKKPNLASQAFRTAANGLQRSDNWLGDYFRKKKAQGGNKYAIVATARKIALIYYKMVRYKIGFSPVDLDLYRKKYTTAKIAYLERKLAELKAQAA
jgi:transposase